jgi:hypothetical protein
MLFAATKCTIIAYLGQPQTLRGAFAKGVHDPHPYDWGGPSLRDYLLKIDSEETYMGC